MLRWIFGGAFYRWGLPGLLGACFLVLAAGWLFLAGFAWLIEGVLYGIGLFSALGYVLLLILLIRWLRGRRSQEHLLEYGRRRWHG